MQARGRASGAGAPSAAGARRLPAGHAQPAEVHPAARQRVLRGRIERASARRGHRRARDAPGGRRVLHRQRERRRRWTTLPFPLTQDVLDRGRAALQHLLHAVPRPDRQRQRHDRAPRLPAAAVVPHRSAAPGADRALLRRDDQRLRRDAGLPRADRAARPLGHRGVHSRAATEPARVGSRRAGRGSAEAVAASQRAIGGRGRSTNADICSPPPRPRNWIALQQRALIVGVAGAVLGAIGVLAEPRDSSSRRG